MGTDYDQLSAPTTALPPGFAVPPGMPTPTAADFAAASGEHGAAVARQPKGSWWPWAVGGGIALVALGLVYHATHGSST